MFVFVVFAIILMPFWATDCKHIRRGNLDNEDKDEVKKVLLLSDNEAKDEVLIVLSEPGHHNNTDNVMGDGTPLSDNKSLNQSLKLSYDAENLNTGQENIGQRFPLGIIPYYFNYSSYDYIIEQRLAAAMYAVKGSSCIQFESKLVPPHGDLPWLHFANPDKQRKCDHEPRYKENGEILVVLGLDCLKNSNILHTLLHAIGFKDEVTHPHRDKYIRVMWENLQPEYRNLYRIQPADDSGKMLVEYDPSSVMHFHDRAFSKNGRATIAPLMPGLRINPSEKLSILDKMKLRLLFSHECNKRNVNDLLQTCNNVLYNKDNRSDHKEGKKGTDEDEGSDKEETQVRKDSDNEEEKSDNNNEHSKDEVEKDVTNNVENEHIEDNKPEETEEDNEPDEILEK